MNFSRSHPFILFVYFFSVTGFAILNNNPIFMLINFLSAYLFRCVSLKSSKVIKELIFYIFLTLAFTFIIPLFSHNGKTIICFMGDNAITREAFIIGLCNGIKASAILGWVLNFTHLMTDEKLCYLVSKISPRLAISISRLLKFIPAVKKKYRAIHNSQTCLYSYIRGYQSKLYIFTKTFSALITWIIEDSAESLDVMYSRGYGLRKRTTFNRYYFERFDMILLFLFSYLLPFTIYTLKHQEINFIFYPEMIYPKLSAIIILLNILWIILSVIPVITEICEEVKWKLLRSKI